VKSWSRQYRSVLFYHSEAQKRTIVASRDREEKKRGAKIHTEILPYGGFHLAEFYHQKYQLQLHHELSREMRAVYPKEADFISSTSAARLNGYVSGYGNTAALGKEVHRLGLSAESVKKLTDLVRKSSQ